MTTILSYIKYIDVVYSESDFNVNFLNHNRAIWKLGDNADKQWHNFLKSIKIYSFLAHRYSETVFFFTESD